MRPLPNWPRERAALPKIVARGPHVYGWHDAREKLHGTKRKKLRDKMTVAEDLQKLRGTKQKRPASRREAEEAS